MTKRKSFILHIDSLGILDSLSDEQAGKLFKAIKSYQVDDELTTDEVIKLVFFPFKSQFERDNEKYKTICDRNKNNGLKGGRPKASETEKTQSVIKEPRKADSDSKNDSDSDNEEQKILSPSSKADPVPYQKIIDLYHKTLPELPTIAKLTPKRKGQIRQRYTEDMKELTNWENFFDYVSQSDFLMGRVQPTNGRAPFRADIEWLTNQTNFTKIAEDKYHV